MLLGARPQNSPLCRNQLDRLQIVESEPVAPHEPPDPAAVCQPRDAGGRYDAPCHRQAM